MTWNQFIAILILNGYLRPDERKEQMTLIAAFNATNPELLADAGGICLALCLQYIKKLLVSESENRFFHLGRRNAHSFIESVDQWDNMNAASLLQSAILHQWADNLPQISGGQL